MPMQPWPIRLLVIAIVSDSHQMHGKARNVPHDWLELRVPVWINALRYEKDDGRLFHPLCACGWPLSVSSVVFSFWRECILDHSIIIFVGTDRASQAS